MELAHSLYQDQLAEVQLQTEDLKNQRCSNNLRLQGLPEVIGLENLAQTVLVILQKILDSDSPPNMELNRVHGALGLKPVDQDRLHDVICRLHHYSQKEWIMRAVWLKGPIDFDGAPISIFPEILRATLQRRTLLKPLLGALHHAELPYRWGFPLHLLFHKGCSSFTLRHYADLPDLSAFLEMEAIPLQDWLHLVPSRDPQVTQSLI